MTLVSLKGTGLSVPLSGVRTAKEQPPFASSGILPVMQLDNGLELVLPGRVLDAKCCEMTITNRDRPVPKTPVTIENLGISPGHGLA